MATTDHDERADEDEAPGWDAISAAFEALYGAGEPAGHWGAVPPPPLGGPPLQGVSAYSSNLERPHWHYVSYGLTELFQKESETANVSGFGFELTFRLAKSPGEEAPPLWPVNLLQNLARYVVTTGNVFSSGHHLPTNGPIQHGGTTVLKALAFGNDPALPAQESPHGSFEFVHLFGITLDELDAIQLWNTESFLEQARASTALLITDLARDSFLADAAFAAQAQALAEREGSNCGVLHEPGFGFSKPWGRKPTIRLCAGEVDLLKQLIPRRLRHGHPLNLIGSEKTVRLEPGPEQSQRQDGSVLTVVLTERDVAALVATLAPRAGRYVAAGLTWIVEKSVIKDQEGNVIEELG